MPTTPSPSLSIPSWQAPGNENSEVKVPALSILKTVPRFDAPPVRVVPYSAPSPPPRPPRRRHRKEPEGYGDDDGLSSGHANAPLPR
jgi:hypothetical protein